jgi:hypothetical protein
VRLGLKSFELIIILAFLGLIFLAPKALAESSEKSDCSETHAAASAKIAAEAERIELIESFPAPNEYRDSYQRCLSALNEYSLPLGPFLAPIPDFGEALDKVCASLKISILDKPLLSLPQIAPILPLNKIRSLSDVAREVRDALR